MRVTVKWRELADRTSEIDMPDDSTSAQINERVHQHVRRSARAAGAEHVESVQWQADDAVKRFGGTF